MLFFAMIVNCFASLLGLRFPVLAQSHVFTGGEQPALPERVVPRLFSVEDFPNKRPGWGTWRNDPHLRPCDVAHVERVMHLVSTPDDPPAGPRHLESAYDVEMAAPRQGQVASGIAVSSKLFQLPITKIELEFAAEGLPPQVDITVTDLNVRLDPDNASAPASEPLPQAETQPEAQSTADDVDRGTASADPASLTTLSVASASEPATQVEPEVVVIASQPSPWKSKLLARVTTIATYASAQLRAIWSEAAAMTVAFMGRFKGGDALGFAREHAYTPHVSHTPGAEPVVHAPMSNLGAAPTQLPFSRPPTAFESVQKVCRTMVTNAVNARTKVRAHNWKGVVRMPQFASSFSLGGALFGATFCAFLIACVLAVNMLPSTSPDDASNVDAKLAAVTEKLDRELATSRAAKASALASSTASVPKERASQAAAAPRPETTQAKVVKAEAKTEAKAEVNTDAKVVQAVKADAPVTAASVQTSSDVRPNRTEAAVVTPSRPAVITQALNAEPARTVITNQRAPRNLATVHTNRVMPVVASRTAKMTTTAQAEASPKTIIDHPSRAGFMPIAGSDILVKVEPILSA